MKGENAMLRGLLLISALLALLVASPSGAYAATAGSITAANGDKVTIELSEGQLIRLDRSASSVFIANPAIADVAVKSPRLVYVFGKKAGRTTLFAVDERENVLMDMTIEVHHNVSSLGQALEQVVPAGKITATSVNGGIVLTGSVPNARDSENVQSIAARFIGEGEQVMNRLAVTEPQQVNLRVRIAEVSRTIINEFGFNWEVAAETGNFLFALATGRDFLNEATGQIIRSEGASLFTGYRGGSVDVNNLIDSLAEDGLITVLAEPNLTALSGETANFLAGGEFPIAVRDEDGVAIEFKEFGVSLAFTPTVLDARRISLRVRPEVSQLTTTGAIILDGFEIPALTTRRAETSVELGSGQSFAIAGMLLDRNSHTLQEVPGLSEIPILGRLFNSEAFQREETELVIIVTPYMVRPSSEPLPTPVDPFVEPPKVSRAETPKSTARRNIPLSTAGQLDPGHVGPAGFVID